MLKEQKKESEQMVTDLKECLAEELIAGKTLSEIKKKYKVSFSFIYGALYTNGINYKELLAQRRKKVKDVNFEKCLSLYMELDRMPNPEEIKRIVISGGKPGVYINLLNRHFLTGYYQEKQAVKDKLVTKNPGELIDELKKITIELGHVPFINEIKSLSKYDHKEFRRCFGTFRGSLRKARVYQLLRNNNKREMKIKKQKQLIAYLQEKSRQLGRLPDKKVLVHDPLHNYMQYYRSFGSFSNALKRANLLENFASK